MCHLVLELLDLYVTLVTQNAIIEQRYQPFELSAFAGCGGTLVDEIRDGPGLTLSTFSITGVGGILLDAFPAGAVVGWLNAGDLLCVVAGNGSGTAAVTGILGLCAGV